MLLLTLLGCEPEPDPSCWVSMPCGPVEDGGACATCSMGPYDGWIECSDGWSLDFGGEGHTRVTATIAAERHCGGSPE